MKHLGATEFEIVQAAMRHDAAIHHFVEGLTTEFMEMNRAKVIIDELEQLKARKA